MLERDRARHDHRRASDEVGEPVLALGEPHEVRRLALEVHLVRLLADDVAPEYSRACRLSKR